MTDEGNAKANIHDRSRNTTAYIHDRLWKYYGIHPSPIEETLRHTSMIDQRKSMAYIHDR